jgi:nucleoside-diphosphate-sugar epimerase
MARIALIGASGFIGSAVKAALDGHDVVAVRAPRVETVEDNPQRLVEIATEHESLGALVTAFKGCQTVVNCGGDPDASSQEHARLLGANALMPRIALQAAAEAGITRFVHVSSAVVQNDKPILDDSEDMRPFSPYSLSKVTGERTLRERPPRGVQVVRYRPPSVHAPGRRVTRMIGRIASSPLAFVAGDGTRPSPQAQLPNVAAAVAFLATCTEAPPYVVAHPSEGVTTGCLLRDLSGGHEPRRLPVPVATFLVGAAKLLGRWHRSSAANARRLELLWLGQSQARSWLTTAGFQPPVGADGWRTLIE